MAKRERNATRFLDALPDDGERRLLLAILLDVLRSLSREPGACSAHERREWLSDQSWLLSDDSNSACGFVSICTALGLDAAYVRRSTLAKLERAQGVRVRRYAGRAADSWAAQSRQQRSRHQAGLLGNESAKNP